MKLTVKQKNGNFYQTIYMSDAEIRVSDSKTFIDSSYEDESYHLEIENKQCVLHRITAESEMEAIFSLGRSTQLFIMTEMGQTNFGVLTKEYSKKDNECLIEYDLIAQGSSVDTFSFIFQWTD